MTIWSRLMNFLRQKPSVHLTPLPSALHDDGYPEAQHAYQRDKEAMLNETVERLARLKRLGYDLDNVTKRGLDATVR